MGSSKLDVLSTAFLWVCFYITFFILRAWLLSGPESPRAPPLALSHHHHRTEPQPVLQSPLWPHELPRPREPREPTFEPRPAPILRQRNVGLTPRAERRERPAASLGRSGPRERPSGNMSWSQRVALADMEMEQERYLAQEEDDLLCRSKALAHEAAEAECMQEATSRTGGDDFSAATTAEDEQRAHEKPSIETQDLHATSEDSLDSPYVYSGTSERTGETLATESGDSERPELANNTTKTADKIDSTTATENGTSEQQKLAINPDVARYKGKKSVRFEDEGSNALTGAALEVESAAAEGSPMDIVQDSSPNPLSASEMPGFEYTSADGSAMDLDQDSSANPLSAGKMRNSYGMPADITSTTVVQDSSPNPLSTGATQDSYDTPADNTTTAAEEQTQADLIAPLQNPLMDRPHSESWQKLAQEIQEAVACYNPKIVDTAWFNNIRLTFKCWSHWMANNDDGIFNHVKGTEDIVLFSQFAHMMCTLIGQILPNVPDEFTHVRDCMDFAEKTIHAYLQEQERARLNEEERKESLRKAQAQAQQQPASTPVEDDLYGSSPKATARLLAYTTSSKDAQTEPQSSTINQVAPDAEAYTPDEMGENIRNQINGHSTEQQQPPQTPDVPVQKARRLTQINRGLRHLNVPRAQPINAVQKAPALPPASTEGKEKKPEGAALWGDYRGKLGEEHWKAHNLSPGDDLHPLQSESTKQARLVLVTAWLQLNDQIIKKYQGLFKQSDWKDKAASSFHGPQIQAQIKLISARYRQIGEYACVTRSASGDLGWNVEKISLEYIQEMGFQGVVSTHEEFLLMLKGALEEDSSVPDELDDIRNMVDEAYGIVAAVSRSIKRIVSPSGLFGTTAVPHGGSQGSSDLSEPSPSLKAKMAKEDGDKKASAAPQVPTSKSTLPFSTGLPHGSTSAAYVVTNGSSQTSQNNYGF